MKKPSSVEGDVRIVEMGTDTGYLCAFCGHWGESIDVDVCAQCTYPLDPVFYEDVYHFADLFRKDS